jgi:hypothetical protein
LSIKGTTSSSSSFLFLVGVAIFDNLDDFLNVSYKIIIFGSHSSLGCRRIAPYDSGGLARQREIIRSK